MKASSIENFSDKLRDAERMAITTWEMNFVSAMKEKYRKECGDLNVTESQISQIECIIGTG